jgi:hypothetical protein
VNRVGQVWDISGDYIALVVGSELHVSGRWVHQLVYLVANGEPFSPLLFPCLEELFAEDSPYDSVVRIA